jgi:branched-chain amino acid transport system permease protein
MNTTWYSAALGGWRKAVGFMLLAAMLCLVPLFVDSPYYIHLLIMSGINAILAMTFTLMLTAGLISLAIAVFWSFGAYTSTLAVMKLDLSFWLALPLSVVVTGIIACGIGYLLVKNTGFGFLILTSVLGMLIALIYGNINWLGGYQGIEAIPPPDPIHIPYVTQIEFVSKVSFYYLMLGLLFFVIIAFSAFYASWAGRAWRAIGLGPNLAESIGVNLHRYRLLSFVVTSMGAGLAGSFYAHYIGAVTPSTFGIFKTIHIHIYAILGGLGFPILGPVVGALIMTFVPEILRITGEIEPIFTGFLIIILIKFLPGGVLSIFAKRKKGEDQTLARLSAQIRSLLSSDR